MMRLESAHHSEAWYVRAFGELYPLVYVHRDDAEARAEVTQLAGVMGLAAGDRVLDIACGAGRHLEALVGLGCDAVGVDLSGSLLGEAAERAALRGRLVRADIRALPFVGYFDAAVNLFTSFGYFENDEENAGALREMVGVLKPGGRIAMDLVNPAVLVREFVPHTRNERDGLVIEQHRAFDGTRVTKRIEISDAGRPDEPSHVIHESVRIYRPDELLGLADRAGLVRARLVGGFDGCGFGEDSRRMILLAERGAA